jgi:hypothetical protein
VDVRVTTYSGTSAVVAADQYTYAAQPAPTVTALSQTFGSSGGGNVLTLTGANFANVQYVSFGGVAASSFTVGSATSLTVTVPPEPAGTVDVTVTTAGGTSALSSADRYTYAAAAAPAVTAVSPSTGSTAGGTVVTVSGSGFTGASAVLFGATPAASFFVNGDGQLTAVAPSQAAGAVDVTVVTPTGTSAVSSSDRFTYTAQAAPTVAAVSPSTGTTAGGAVVTVTGTGFTGATGVSFGSVAAASFTVLSDTTLTATAPAQAAATVDVTVTTYGGTSATGSADHFTYTTAAAPAVTGVTPNTGLSTGGAAVTLTGSGFTGATAVNFGAVAATAFTVLSDTALLATAPAQAAGTVDVKVTTYSGTSSTSAADQFTYTTAPAPAVTGVSPSSGTTAGGTLVTLSGSGFTGAYEVDFGSTPVFTFTVNTDGQITVLSPPGPAGVWDVRVTTAAGASALSSSDRFTVTAAAAPAVTGLGTTAGTTAGGTSVAVSGSGFTGATGVFFGAVAAAFTVNSDTSLTATAPPQAAGTVHVTVTTYAGTSSTSAADQFTYNAAPAPSVTAVGPSSGLASGGTVVTVTGAGFTGASAVSFGGTAALTFSVVSDGAILATAPAGTAGTVDVVVTTPSGQSATGAADHFTYTAVPTPAITSLNPSTGGSGGGTSVTISGSGFANATGVFFGGVAASSFIIVSDSSITAVAPPEAAGTVDVTVTAYGTVSGFTNADRFVYSPNLAPAVTGLGTTSGSTAGGTSVTVSGSGFTGATGVTFGGTAASFTVRSDGWLTATAPAHAAGTVDVVVTTPSGSSATGAADRYTYAAAASPAVTGLTPASGGTAGGTTVTITGSGFTGATAVNFGSVAAASFNVLSDNAISAVAPAAAAGTIDVTVTTPAGTSATSSADRFAFSAPGAPSVTSVSPTSGGTGGGTAVIVRGAGFTGATGVSFGAYAAASFIVDSDTQLTAVAPAQAAGTVDVTVTTPGGTSATGAADRFSYSAAAAPSVTAVSPSSGPPAGGTVVTVTGSGFTGATAVKFGSVAAAWFTVLSDTAVEAAAPAEAAGVVDVTVTTYSGTSATGTADQFTFVADPALSPSQFSGFNPQVGVPWSGTVVSFRDADPNGAASQYTAIISWGNGQVTFGQITAGAQGAWNVVGTMTYSATGTYAVVVQITDVGGASLTLQNVATVTGGGSSPVRPAPQATGVQATATHGVAFSGAVASFRGDIAGGTVANYTATIDWGVGAGAVAAQVRPLGNNQFAVVGGHTYAKPGTYTVTITIRDSGGGVTTVTSTILVADASGSASDGDGDPDAIDPLKDGTEVASRRAGERSTDERAVAVATDDDSDAGAGVPPTPDGEGAADIADRLVSGQTDTNQAPSRQEEADDAGAKTPTPAGENQPLEGGTFLVSGKDAFFILWGDAGPRRGAQAGVPVTIAPDGAGDVANRIRDWAALPLVLLGAQAVAGKGEDPAAVPSGRRPLGRRPSMPSPLD